MEYKCIISVDPGLKGAFSIFDGNKNPIIYKIPLKTVIKSNKKKKNIYDLERIVEILELYRNKNVIFGIERQSARVGEGVTSSFTNGTGYGSLLGIAHGLKFDVIIVSPVTWKKYFPELITKNSENLKNKQKTIRLKIKNIKDNDLEKQYKKEIEKIGRQVKAEAKSQSRVIAQKLYPKLNNEFLKVSDDGKSDAVLIGVYLKNKDF